MNDDHGLYEQNAHPPRRRPSRYSPNVATSALNSNKVSAYPTTVLATIVAPIFTSTSTWHRSNIAQLAAVSICALIICYLWTDPACPQQGVTRVRGGGPVLTARL